MIRAFNYVGAGEASEAVFFTPSTVPDAPTIDSHSAGGGFATVRFTPGADGGAPILGHEVSVDGGAWTDYDGFADDPENPTSFEAVVAGLTDGVPASIRVRSFNLVGPGAASAPVTVTSVSKPSAPTSVTITPGPGSVTIEVVPGDDGGDPITDWEYTLDEGETWITVSPRPTGTTFTIGGLDEDTEYTISVRPVNAQGTGVPSEPYSFTTTNGDAGSGALPYTGGESQPLAIGGLALLLAGGALVLLRRRGATA